MRRVIIGGAAILAVGGVAGDGLAQGTAAPKARYQMDVSTTTGLGAMGQGGGGLGAAMAMMRGGGGREARSVELRLGSVLTPSGAPAADHFLPPAMRMGASVPLVTPTGTTPRDEPGGMRTPRGRLLLYWGCGAKAGPGQPIVIDFSKMARGQVPPGLYSARVPLDRGPTMSNSRTYGYWPNANANDRGRRVSVSSDSSLIGDHRVAGNYAPEIKFALARDFMGGLNVNSRDSAGGATALNWGPVASATGYYASAMGFDASQARGQDDIGEMVWWTSAARQEFGGGLSDWLPPATVARLIGEKVVMPPTQTACEIPAEVKGNGRMLTLMMTAFGPEANFAFPPRPANPKAAWSPEWTAKVRYRSTTMSMLGMPGMGDMMRDEDESEAPTRGSNRPSQPRAKCGFLQRAAGLC